MVTPLLKVVYVSVPCPTTLAPFTDAGGAVVRAIFCAAMRLFANARSDFIWVTNFVKSLPGDNEFSLETNTAIGSVENDL